MDQQLSLFDLPKPSIQEMLLSMAELGSLFYSVSDVARMTGYTGYQVYWAIWFCRLDAVSVCGQWRIPYTAILQWIDHKDELEQQYELYRLQMKEREVPGFWEARKMLKLGSSHAEVKMFLVEEKGLVVTDYLVELITRHSPIDRQADTEEETLDDWYDLQDLPFPGFASLHGWATILRVPTDSLVADHHWNDHRKINKKQMLGYLIEREIVNIPVFSTRMIQCNPPEDEDLGQLPLF